MIKVFSVISQPVKAINSFKKVNPGRTLGYLLLVAVINTVALGILTWKAMGWSSTYALVLVGYLVLGFVAALFSAYLLKLAVNILGGNGQYYNGLTALTLGMIAPAIGLLLFSLLTMIPNVGSVLGLIVMAIALVLGFATTIRAIKELFRVDTLTAVIGLIIADLALILAIYLTVAQTMLGSDLFTMNLGGTKLY